VDLYGCLMGTESSSEAGVPASGEPHDFATITAVVYGKEELGEYVDKHEEWLAATGDWTFDEIRSVLYEEANGSALLGGDLTPVAGWCRCGDHADLIESFLSDYGLRYDDEGWVVDMLAEEEEGEDGDS
jgi:hypothetical protein